MRCAALVMIFVLSGCSEWSLRSMIRSNAMGPDTADTGLGGPGGPDTAPPDDEGPGAGLPTHCSAADNPPIKPVWNHGEGPGNPHFWSYSTGSIDFDAQGRLLWVNQGKLNWADRSGNHGILDPEGDYLWQASIKVLPDGGLVVAGQSRIFVRNPDTGETMRIVEGNLGERFRYRDTIEVDSDNHFYTEYEFGAILRILSHPAHQHR